MKLLIISISLFFSINLKAQSRGSEITCEPSRVNGKIVGFYCPKLHRESLLSKSGLKSGDLIVAYDGNSISSFKSMQKFYEKLHRKGKTHIKIKRGNDTLFVENMNK